ncbi:MAG: hypothetical protein NT120_00650 [Candidatus Aenigmarchaeota archaeon]|nr:hypothetical protein [Candidatus Aenigmarchaeota archaeon]
MPPRRKTTTKGISYPPTVIDSKLPYLKDFCASTIDGINMSGLLLPRIFCVTYCTLSTLLEKEDGFRDGDIRKLVGKYSDFFELPYEVGCAIEEKFIARLNDHTSRKGVYLGR